MSLPGLDLPTLSFAPATEPPSPGVLTVDLDQLITSRLLIQGSSGAGKGWAIRTLLEQTHGRVQQLVLDKEGEFSTLREKYDYILAGAEGDVPATPHTARLPCRQLMDLGASAVLDLYDLSLPDRRKFVRLFLEELMGLPKELWRPLLVVIDEAHFFAPEGGSTEASAAVTSLCAEGRKRGYAAIIATQRLSKLSKDVAAELRNKMIGLTSLDVDVRRAADDLGFGREQAARLKELEPGQFFCVGPAMAKKVVLARTGDVQTTHPKAGQIAAYTPPPPADAVKALLEQLKGLAAEAEAEVRAEQEKADRTEALARQVESLQKQLAERTDQAPGGAKERIVEVERIVEKFVEVPALLPGQVEELCDIADTLASGGKDMLGMAQEILARVAAVSRPPHTPGAVDSKRPKDDKPIKTQNIDTLEEHVDAVGISNAPAPLPEKRLNSPVSRPQQALLVTRPQQAILNTLATLAALGLPQPQRVHVALFAGVSLKSSAFMNNLGALRTAGLLDYPGTGLVTLTAAGSEIAQASNRPLTVRELQKAWLAWLTAPQRRIVETLITCYPEAMTKPTLAQQAEASATSSAFMNNLGALRTLGLVSYPEKGKVAATALLFPEGSPG